jgi:hypothetical protein
MSARVGSNVLGRQRWLGGDAPGHADYIWFGNRQ